jgi:hypothetical protein
VWNDFFPDSAQDVKMMLQNVNESVHSVENGVVVVYEMICVAQGSSEQNFLAPARQTTRRSTQRNKSFL